MAVTIGCDPEILVFNGDYTINVDWNHTSNEHGNIGIDHAGRVAELRPKEGTPAEVTKHIRWMMKWIKEKHPTIQVVAGGGEGTLESIGGHIHFGNLGTNLEYWSTSRIVNRHRAAMVIDPQQNPNHKLIWALDFFIGCRMKKVPGGKRGGHSHYGRPGDVESKPHGFEYRTPPSWVSCPTLTEATLCVAKQVAEMWKLKNSFFDELLSTKKMQARRRDYNILIPSSGPDRTYILQQVNNYRNIVFSKSYNMASKDCLTKWTTPQSTTQIENQIPQNRIIEMKICQLKHIDFTTNFHEESVLKICRFALPEIKIHSFNEYTPWNFHLTRNLKLRPNTIYLTKDLRPFLKIKRDHNFKIRFINTGNNTSDSRLSSVVLYNNRLSSAVLYNKNSSSSLLDHIINIFETCARTKFKI